MNECLVSVIIPVYNIEQHLQECMDSVLKQSLKNIEVICVDDGSTDGSGKILDEYGKCDRRIKVIHQENAGPGSARNTGLQYARGRFLIFLDSDDWFELDFLESIVEKALQTGANIVICRADEFESNSTCLTSARWMLKDKFIPNETFTPEDIKQYIFQFTYGWAWDKLYERRFVEQHKLQFPELPNSEDLVFVFQSLALAKKIAILDQVFVHHRINRLESVSNSRQKAIDAPMNAVMQLKKSLENHNAFKQFERSFMNWAMDFLVWNAANLGDGIPAKSFYFQLKRIWIPQLQFSKYRVSYFFDKRAYLKYMLVTHSSYAIFMRIVNLNRRLKLIKKG